jgi:hypothetical protein
MKTCSHCRQDKPEPEFHKNRAMSDGLQNQCKQCHSVARLKWRDKSKSGIADWSRSYNYGMLPGEFDHMMKQQSGACAICGSRDKKLNVDHHHESGMVRQLLCHKCNMLVGFLEDPHVLAAEEYIRRHAVSREQALSAEPKREITDV